MVLTVTSEPRAKESVIATPEVSTYGVKYWMTAVRLPWLLELKLRRQTGLHYCRMRRTRQRDQGAQT